MGMKLGFSPYERKVDWGCVRGEHRGEILEYINNLYFSPTIIGSFPGAKAARA
jgi:hypothetical protein